MRIKGIIFYNNDIIIKNKLLYYTSYRVYCISYHVYYTSYRVYRISYHVYYISYRVYYISYRVQ